MPRELVTHAIVPSGHSTGSAARMVAASSGDAASGDALPRLAGQEDRDFSHRTSPSVGVDARAAGVLTVRSFRLGLSARGVVP